MKNKVEINTMDEFIEAVKTYNLPEELIEDVSIRIAAWEDRKEIKKDTYTKQQFLFLETYINFYK